MKDEAEIAAEDGPEAAALRHLLNDLGALSHQGLVVAGGEELVDEERPRHEDEEERVAKLGLGVHAVGVTVETDVQALVEVVGAVISLGHQVPDAVVVSAARLDITVRPGGVRNVVCPSLSQTLHYG